MRLLLHKKTATRTPLEREWDELLARIAGGPSAAAAPAAPPETAPAEEATAAPAEDVRPKPSRQPGAPRPQGGPAWWHGARGGRRSRRRTVTVSLTDEAVRVVVFEGLRVVAWGTAARDEEHAAQDQGDASQGLVAAEQSQALLGHLDIRGGRIVSDLPLHAPILRRLDLPKVGRRYLEQVVTSELAEAIPFPLEEVDLAWQARRKGEGHEALAIAVSKTALDERVAQLRRAGLRVRALYPQAVALAHASGLRHGIIAHLEAARAVFVLVSDGVPQAVYQQSLPAESAPPQEQAEVVGRATELVAGYAEIAGARDGEGPVRIVLTGQLASHDPLVEALRLALPGEVLRFTTPIVCPEHFAPAEYAVNLGLAVADRSWLALRRRGQALGQRALNLLPERHRPRPLPLRPIAAFVALALFGAVAFNLAQTVSTTAGEAAALSARVSQARVQAREHRLTLARTGTVQREAQELRDLGGSLASFLTDRKVERQELLARLETITGTALPPGVALANVNPRGDGFFLTGTAPSFEDALAYTASLRASGLFQEVRLTEVQVSGGGPAPDGGRPQPGAATVTFKMLALVPGAPEATTKK